MSGARYYAGNQYSDDEIEGLCCERALAAFSLDSEYCGVKSGASSSFKSLSYKLNPNTGLIDFDQAYERAMDFHSKTLICGASPYPRDREYAKFRLF
ncbi:hypothetical protein M5K25_022761 [Dendrobium thyrsiflorum]|uniref:Serine hydroxymethyltransferase-like domain-containing protein n=1 Tax=Dendrobium thyrsiflorum TaxID=117978 RepID=A0ABD0U6T4_DENTH